jgi:hypothetical protein
VVDESLPPDAGRDAPAPPQLTPIERAAREEQGGPGVLVRLKEAIPFTGAAADTPTRRATAVAATVTTAANTAADKSAAADGAGQAGTTDASPGLLSRLKSTLPFGGESNDDREQATEEDTYKDADFLESGGQDEEEDAATPDESFRQARLRDDERYEAVAAPPPVAPTAGPLENRIAAPAEEIADEIDVPADATPKKRGFFARLFGRDRPEDTGGDPDARERRRYRDLSDPAAE